MKLYAGIDLHSNNNFLAISDIGEHAKPGEGYWGPVDSALGYQFTKFIGFQVLPNSFRFAATWAKNVLLPTPAISQTSAAVLSEFSYKILAFSNFAGSVLGLPPVLPRALADKLPAARRVITYHTELSFWHLTRENRYLGTYSFSFSLMVDTVNRYLASCLTLPQEW